MFSKFIGKLSSLSVRQWIVIIILIILFVWAIRKANTGFSKAWRKFWEGTRDTDGTLDEPVDSDVRKNELEIIAQDLYDAIYCVWCWSSDTTDVLNRIYGLPDNEFVYVVNHYEKYLSENTMYYDIDWEILGNTDVDEKVMNRLKSMNLD